MFKFYPFFAKLQYLRDCFESHCEERFWRRSNLRITRNAEIASQKRLAMTFKKHSLTAAVRGPYLTNQYTASAPR
jgi:hypothetical protein